MFRIPAIRRLVPVLATAALVAGCSDSTEPEEEPEVQTMTLTVGANTVTFNKTTGTASGPLVVPSGSSTVTAAYRRADGSIEPLVTSADFDLRITGTAGTLAFTPNGAFGGTLVLTGLSSNQTTTAQVSLFHKVEQHPDFGPYPLTIRIQ